METTHKLFSLKYTILRKNRKNISIKIDKKGKVIIIAPNEISYKAIEEVVKSKMPWILKGLQTIKEKMESTEFKGIQEGKKILWMGTPLDIEKYPLNIQKCYVKIFKDRFVIYGFKTLLEDEENITITIHKFYREKAKVIFKHRVDVYSKKINVCPRKISIRCQKTIWGSCYSSGNINFNYKLLMAPIEIIDYIVVHELCHLVHMNHSKDYWKLVEYIIPDYINKKNWLKNNGYMLAFPENFQ
ncbi:M48 family metallopeptidase [Clostridium sp. WILCCON 0269]|uniref:M48 family metallopeptidase n=1 Tax=Candidatus Clostridium eludens TaxID=3381663 RepID=A0ABW8SFU9_9CLOT